MFLCSVTSIVSDSAIPRTIARLSPLSMGFFKHEYWGGLPFPFPRDLPNPRIEPGPGIGPRSPTLQGGALPSEPPGKNS